MINPEAPRCVVCDLRIPNQADLIAHEKKCREMADCACCQQNKGKMHPPHFASLRCESGRRNHCSCDVCF